MDSPHFMWFCFLLLTVAAPSPNIAMPSAKRAEGTQTSSKTNVTAYRCKVCELYSYEGCEKIGETHNKAFSNEIIQLETNETFITMCFQQENTSLEGVYAIVWVKDVGIGDSCGPPSSEASSQNLSGRIICCEAEINLAVPNHSLNCYSKVSGRDDGKSTVNITVGEGLDNHQFLFSKTRIGIITLLGVIGVCGAAALAVYCARRNQNRQDDFADCDIQRHQ